MPELLNTTHVVSKFWLQRRKSTQCHKQRESLYPWEMGRWAVCLAPCPVWPAAAPVSPTWYSALGFWWLPTPFVLSHCRTGDEDKGVIDDYIGTLHGPLWLPCTLATPLSNVSSLNSPVFICLMLVPYLICFYIILKIENYMTSIFWQSRNFIWGIWRREWQSTPVFSPGEFHGQRRLAGYSLLGLKESDMTEQLTLLQ